MWARRGLLAVGGMTQFVYLQQQLPQFTREEVAKKNDPSVQMWVTFKDGVYDVTKFHNHPGGQTFLRMAAGGAVDPYFAYWATHLSSSKVKPLLESMRIGTLSDYESEPEDTSFYDEEPKRDSHLIATRDRPFSSMTESPALFRGGFLTPPHLLFVRNHAPVPQTSPDDHILHVALPSQNFELTLEEIKAMEFTTVTSMIQCAGNRGVEAPCTQGDPAFANRKEGMVGNVAWTGVPLAKFLGSRLGDIKTEDYHLHMEGADGYFDSVPLSHVLNPEHEALLAVEMNGQPITPDHGSPLRLVIPGVAGARNIKWLRRLGVSNHPSEGPWQQNFYKIHGEPLLQMPMTSVILEVEPRHTQDSWDVKGIAFGAGVPITRVEVCSARSLPECDWKQAKLLEDLHAEGRPSSRKFSWQRWVADEVAASKEDSLWCRAFDANGAGQPEHPDNKTQYFYNGWHRVAPPCR